MPDWNKAQKHERTYLENGKNLQWNTPHGFDYWKKFLGISSIPNEVLEIGCGPNGLWRFSYNVVGLDPIDFSKLGDNFIQGKGENLPFESNTFDMIICCNSLDHCEKPSLVVSEMIRVLKHGGKLIIWSNVFPEWFIPVLDVFDPHPYYFTSKSLIELIPFSSSYYREVLYSESHLKYVVNKWARLKLRIAELIGVHGVLIHFN